MKIKKNKFVIVSFLIILGGFILNFGQKKIFAKSVNEIPQEYMRKPISYTKSSEIKPYPHGMSAKKDKIVVSLKKQRAYLIRGRKTRYEFYVSTGADNSTPKGHFRINTYRAPWFYSASEKMGARFAVGWLQGGLYLFHENPRNIHHKLIKKVANKLGKKPTSHGCIHLSTSDANWFYQKAPTGLRVIIK